MPWEGVWGVHFRGGLGGPSRGVRRGVGRGRGVQSRGVLVPPLVGASGSWGQTPPVALHVLSRSDECVRARRSRSVAASSPAAVDELVDDAHFFRELRIDGGKIRGAQILSM